jgi:hypothetical protein
MAVAMLLPFLFSSEVRVAGEAAVFVFMAVASRAEWRPLGQLAIVGILALNLSGILVNYGMFHSTQHDIRGARVPLDASQPAYQYQAWREEARQKALGALGVVVSPRSLE